MGILLSQILNDWSYSVIYGTCGFLAVIIDEHTSICNNMVSSHQLAYISLKTCSLFTFCKSVTSNSLLFIC